MTEKKKKKKTGSLAQSLTKLNLKCKRCKQASRVHPIKSL